MSEDIIIEFCDVEKRFGSHTVLQGVNLKILRGECMVIIGRSGCGKSVLLKNLIGLLKPTRGSIRVEGQDVVGFNEVEMVPIRRKVGIVFQGGALFDSLSVEQNVAFPLLEERRYTRQEIRERVADVLEAVGLPNQQKKMPSALSGGMKKRVSLARAIVSRPEVILFDEPTTGLDPVRTDSINKLINRMNDRYGTTSIVVTHDMKTVFTCADRVAMLHEGVIYRLATPEEIQKDSDPIVQNFIHGVSSGEDIDI